MKARVLAVGMAAAVLLLTPQPRVQLPTATQRFAAELGLCRQAAADDKPGRCALFGKIQVVDAFPDVKVQRVDAFGDIKVKWVDAFADSPGEWQRVDAFGDYKVQFVDAFGDYRIEEVDAFPGCD